MERNAPGEDESFEPSSLDPHESFGEGDGRAVPESHRSESHRSGSSSPDSSSPDSPGSDLARPDSLRPDFLGYWLDALSEDERDTIELGVSHSPAMRRAYQAFRAQIRPLPTPPRPTPPPPGLAERTLAAIWETHPAPTAQDATADDVITDNVTTDRVIPGGANVPTDRANAMEARPVSPGSLDATPGTHPLDSTVDQLAEAMLVSKATFLEALDRAVDEARPTGPSEAPGSPHAPPQPPLAQATESQRGTPERLDAERFASERFVSERWLRSSEVGVASLTLGLLAVIALPGLLSWRDDGRQAVGRDNLRQVGLMLASEDAAQSALAWTKTSGLMPPGPDDRLVGLLGRPLRLTRPGEPSVGHPAEGAGAWDDETRLRVQPGGPSGETPASTASAWSLLIGSEPAWPRLSLVGYGPRFPDADLRLASRPPAPQPRLPGALDESTGRLVGIDRDALPSAMSPWVAEMALPTEATRLADRSPLTVFQDGHVGRAVVESPINPSRL